MRKCRLAHKPTQKSHSPEFKLPERAESKSDVDKFGRPTNMVAVYWPRIKGGFSLELLRRYWHESMPPLLDAWPQVVTWTSKVEPVLCTMNGEEIEFTPSFRVTEVGGSYALYLHSESGVPATGAAIAGIKARHEFLSALFLSRGDRLQFISHAEVEGHPHLSAAMEIFYHRYWEWPRDLPREIAVILSRESIPTLGMLLRRLGGGGTVWEQLLSLIANGYIDIDLDAGLGDTTPILSSRSRGFV